jgi:hypothetical protein
MPDGSTVLAPAQEGLTVAPPPKPRPEKKQAPTKDAVNRLAFTMFADAIRQDPTLDEKTKNDLGVRAIKYIDGVSKIMPRELAPFITRATNQLLIISGEQTPRGTGVLSQILQMSAEEKAARKARKQ